MTQIDKETENLLHNFHANGGKTFEHFSAQENRDLYKINVSARLDSLSIASVYDQTITTRDKAQIQLRIYDPRKETNTNLTSAILFIHGGGWVVGDLDSHDSICRFIAHHTHIPVIAVDYRLAPEYPFPYPLNDSLDALNYVVENANELFIDPQNLIIFGDSAGGNLATVIAHQFNQQSNFKITTEVLFYPVMTMITDSKSYQTIDDNYPLSAKTMHWFIENYLGNETDLRNPQLSPLYNQNIHPELKTFIMTAGLDPLCDEGVEYANRLILNGNFVEFHHIPHTIHGILTTAKAIGLGKEYLLKSCHFINKKAE